MSEAFQVKLKCTDCVNWEHIIPLKIGFYFLLKCQSVNNKINDCYTHSFDDFVFNVSAASFEPWGSCFIENQSLTVWLSWGWRM